jgi:hypothetical protein
MNRFELFTADDQPLNLSIQLKGKEIVIKDPQTTKS